MIAPLYAYGLPHQPPKHEPELKGVSVPNIIPFPTPAKLEDALAVVPTSWSTYQDILWLMQAVCRSYGVHKTMLTAPGMGERRVSRAKEALFLLLGEIMPADKKVRALVLKATGQSYRVSRACLKRAQARVNTDKDMKSKVDDILSRLPS
jgi:hypothetical protein